MMKVDVRPVQYDAYLITGHEKIGGKVVGLAFHSLAIVRTVMHLLVATLERFLQEPM